MKHLRIQGFYPTVFDEIKKRLLTTFTGSAGRPAQAEPDYFAPAPEPAYKQDIYESHMSSGDIFSGAGEIHPELNEGQGFIQLDLFSSQGLGQVPFAGQQENPMFPQDEINRAIDEIQGLGDVNEPMEESNLFNMPAESSPELEEIVNEPFQDGGLMQQMQQEQEPPPWEDPFFMGPMF